ncbi:MAG: cellulase family glycosylhydrolase [Actinobacteria bacterium]|nr:cellulase family glycosylhydrolase [Actinomycetota bacterium]
MKGLNAARLSTAVVVGLAFSILVSACSSSSLKSRGHSTALPTPVRSAKLLVAGPLDAPGGPFLYDRYGRVVILHGVNAVYKRPPYELISAPGKPYNFSAADAKEIASLGFDVVRLGILWQGLEPGTLGPNNPTICTPGKPTHAHQYNASVAERYLERIGKTVSLLAKYGIYSLIDMHQDVYNQIFGGEGAPAWAVCTDGLEVTKLSPDWSLNYAQPAVGAAYSNFWHNSVVGNLQGNYDKVWQVVAEYFRGNPWVLGYDLFNEPYDRTLLTNLSEGSTFNAPFDSLLQCFYAGKEFTGHLSNSKAPISCPPNDPRIGLIPRIQAISPHKLLFFERDIFTSGPDAGWIGPMPFHNLVLNIHDYCPTAGESGNPPPSTLHTCASDQARTISLAALERAADTTSQQPGGPAWFLSEFGATNSIPDIDLMTSIANENLLGWTYWAWKYYDDPTGNPNEALARPNGALHLAKARALAQTYAQAIAGIPEYMSYDPSTAKFELRYRPNPHITEPTVVFVPESLNYPKGYCARAIGATIISRPNATHLLIRNEPAETPNTHLVTVSVTKKPCR